jgi:hypothetical protein
MKFEIALGGGKLTFEAETLQEIMQQSVFYLQLPTHCPVDGDGTLAVFSHNRDSEDNDYYGLVSTGIIPYEYKFGIRKGDHKLYPKFWPHEVWVMYDAERKANVAVWLNGKTLSKPYPIITMNKRTVLFNGNEVQVPMGRKILNDDDQGEIVHSATLLQSVPTEFGSSAQAIVWAVNSKFYPDEATAKTAFGLVYRGLSEVEKINKPSVWFAWTKHCVALGVQRG